jgi:hypothetical protein
MDEDTIGTDDYVRLLNETALVAHNIGEPHRATDLLAQAVVALKEIEVEE